MAVDEPGHGEAAAEVQAARVGTDEARDLGVPAEGGDAPTADGERLYGARVSIEREDLAASEHEIGRGHGAYSTIAARAGSICFARSVSRPRRAGARDAGRARSGSGRPGRGSQAPP